MILKKPPSSVVLSLVLLIVLTTVSGGCRSTADLPDVDIDEQSGPFLERPRFEKPASRPLGRILLSWQLIDGSEGYELQMSDSAEFRTIEKSWTIRGVNLELSVPTGETRWFRVRSFNTDTRSSWSAPLEVDGGSL